MLKTVAVALSLIVCSCELTTAQHRISIRAIDKEVVSRSAKPVSEIYQDDEDWPSLSYLRSDYKAVRVVAHILIREAKITSRIVGYENWTVSCEVLESFKGKFRKGDVFTYVHGAEAGFKNEYFTGEKIVFLLAESDKDKKEWRYSVLENSTLPYTESRVKKLRSIRNSMLRKSSRQTSKT
jgi:hypothetical protein